MGRNKHFPKATAAVPPKGARAESNPDDTNRQTPVWSIAIFDHAGPWGRTMCETPGHLWEDIFPKLKNYETMTWGEIYRDRDRNHPVGVLGLIKEAQDRLVALKLDDNEELFRFRLSGTGRVWGIRVGRVFQLLWWDPDHKICPSTKR